LVGVGEFSLEELRNVGDGFGADPVMDKSVVVPSEVVGESGEVDKGGDEKDEDEGEV
jgi:hypothetical protein